MSEECEMVEPIVFNLTYFAGLFFLMAWLGIFPSVLVGYWYFITFSFSPLYFILLIPLFLLLYGLALLSSLISARIGVWIVNKRIAPFLPGSYPITMENPHTRAFILRGNIRNFGRWLFYFPHLNFLRVLWLRGVGLKIGKNVKLGRLVQDDDSIEIGDNTFMAKECVIAGHLMDQTQLTLNPTIIGKNCIFYNVTGSVGGSVGDNSVFLPVTGAMKGQICRGNAIYKNVPCKKVMDNNLTPEEIKAMKKEIKKIDKTNFIKQKNAPIKISGVKMFLMKFAVMIGGCLFALTILFPTYLFFSAVLSQTNYLWNILILALGPILLLLILAFFIIGTTLFIKTFIVYYDRKAEIPEGTYELDDPRAKYFKIKYFLRLFGVWLFHGTPFKLIDILGMRVWGGVKFADHVKMDDAVVDPQYLEVDDYSQIAMGARVHTHDIINGKLYIKKVKIGKNCIVGAYAHVKPGLVLADGSVIGVAAWMRKNRRCKRTALWVGKPAFELPVELVTKAAKLEGKYVD